MLTQQHDDPATTEITTDASSRPRCDMPPVSFTLAGLRRGVRGSMPFALGTLPFGLVFGMVAQSHGLSLAEALLMSGTVYAGSAQLVAMGGWSHPAPLVASMLAAFVVNLRLALMGPVLSPWLDRLSGLRLWGSLYLMADQNWALCVKDMNEGGRDAGVLLGSGLLLWMTWVVTTGIGHGMGAVLRPPAGHPVFFAALAVFVTILCGLWRGRVDVLPWLSAAAVAILVAWMLPGTFWHIVCGALAGSMVGGVRDHLRAQA